MGRIEPEAQLYTSISLGLPGGEGRVTCEVTGDAKSLVEVDMLGNTCDTAHADAARVISGQVRRSTCEIVS